ncbi:NADH-quinone oxidoreductase subunit E [Acidocella aquatica]|uniref:NADH-quinone oxidoreductase subunit E n=1 Tax=Acidocella aquatica TaxID=1922313 RepID=A0ABQ6A0L9_9PROT|nr:NADH-quinone oxidoreductase subunit NuoE [Acidocella aquatica]GLR65994.1 NADH-quinone oxidoreductase subunit E [Acidocella aquatica]
MSTAESKTGLTATERSKIEMLSQHYEDKRSACIEVLKYVQGQYRWISNHHLSEIAALLNMSRAELEGVATYYNLIFRQKVGEHVIFLCDSVSCWIMGRDVICEHLRRRLGIEPGETTADGAYTLLPIVCIGHCDHAPAMLLDDELHGDLDIKRIDALLASPTERGL